MSTYAREKMQAASTRFHAWEGTTERPAGSNRVQLAGIGDLWSYVYPPYQGGAWCAAADVAAYLHVGVDLRKLMTNPYYCPNWVALAKSNGWLKTSGAVEGDLVMYGTGGYSVHTGIAKPAPGALFYAHEGNTSSGAGGSQADGGGAFHRGRGRSWIVGWVDMEKVVDYMVRAGLHTPEPEQALKPSTPKKSSKAPRLLAVDGELGPRTYYLLSRATGQNPRVANGTWTRSDVKRLQTWLDVTADGAWGPNTTKALERKLSKPINGRLSASDVRALQRYLNRGVLAGRYTLPATIPMR